MSTQDLYINNYCLIRNNSVSKNGSVVFDSDKTGAAWLHAAYDHFGVGYPKFYKMDALGKLGIIAADILLKNADIQQYAPEETGVVLSNNNASIEADISYFESSKSFPSPSLFVYTLPNIVIGEISIRYGFKGENAFFICEQFDAPWLHFYVNDLMQNHNLKACLCGWADVVNDKYDACLFFVEAKKNNGINFTVENLDTIYRTL